MEEQTTEKKPRGFAALTPEQRAEISRRGGQSAHASGHAHKFTHAEAKVAGRKGGAVTKAKTLAKRAAPAP